MTSPTVASLQKQVDDLTARVAALEALVSDLGVTDEVSGWKAWKTQKAAQK